jgi:hypothetical protein
MGVRAPERHTSRVWLPIVIGVLIVAAVAAYFLFFNGSSGGNTSGGGSGGSGGYAIVALSASQLAMARDRLRARRRNH